MSIKSRNFAEAYVTRMFYLAPQFVIESILNGDSILCFTQTGFIIKPSKKRIDSSYPKVKQWVEGYLAVTPEDDPSAVGSILNISYN